MGAIALIGAPAAACVPALGEILKGASLTRRVAAAEALGAIGPSARLAVPTLEEVLKDRRREAREAARTALERIRGRG